MRYPPDEQICRSAGTAPIGYGMSVAIARSRGRWRKGRVAMNVELPVEIGAGRKDAIGLALLTLAQELWVVKDRQMVTEALLRDRGLLEALDSYQPDADLAARLATERDRFVRSITTMLLTGKPAES